MSNPRAVRYRRLALAEEVKERADLLYKLADEADRRLGHRRVDDCSQVHARAGEKGIMETVELAGTDQIVQSACR
jgi:hypothetical protein